MQAIAACRASVGSRWRKKTDYHAVGHVYE